MSILATSVMTGSRHRDPACGAQSPASGADATQWFGINVNVVHPGLTRTERTAPMIQARSAAQGVTPQEVEAQMAAGNSINHIVDAAEVAHVVAFLCSPKSRAINGDMIAAGGGAPRTIHY